MIARDLLAAALPADDSPWPEAALCAALAACRPLMLRADFPGLRVAALAPGGQAARRRQLHEFARATGAPPAQHRRLLLRLLQMEIDLAPPAAFAPLWRGRRLWRGLRARLIFAHSGLACESGPIDPGLSRLLRFGLLSEHN